MPHAVVQLREQKKQQATKATDASETMTINACLSCKNARAVGDAAAAGGAAEVLEALCDFDALPLCRAALTLGNAIELRSGAMKGKLGKFYQEKILQLTQSCKY